MTLTGTELIAAERERQIDQLGYTQEHDQEHVDSDLAFAAAVYAAPATIYLLRISTDAHLAEHGDGGRVEWVEPWPLEWDRKPRAVTNQERIDELTKAGALIAAELDRLIALQDQVDEEDEDEPA